jgi:hypothetical protein
VLSKSSLLRLKLLLLFALSFVSICYLGLAKSFLPVRFNTVKEFFGQLVVLEAIREGVHRAINDVLVELISAGDDALFVH